MRAADPVRFKEYSRKFLEKHKERLYQRWLEKYTANKALYAQKAREYRAKHGDKVRAKTREWMKANKAYLREYFRRRRQTDPSVVIVDRLRSRMRTVMSGRASNGYAVNFIGCTREQLKAHLEARFSLGMSWQNYGTQWHIDHIKPISWFNIHDPVQKRACCHYTNLQPLWAADNLRKGNRYCG